MLYVERKGSDAHVTHVGDVKIPPPSYSLTDPQLDPTLGRKFDSGKPQYGLLPPFALEEVVNVLTNGAKKYAPDNWRYVDNAKVRYFDAMMRHVWAWKRGELIDAEYSTHHLAHAICCLMFLLDVDLTNNEEK